MKLTNRAYGWPEDSQFLVPDGVNDHFAAAIRRRGATVRNDWKQLFAAYRRIYGAMNHAGRW